MMETYANNLEAIVDDRTRQVIGKFSKPLRFGGHDAPCTARTSLLDKMMFNVHRT